MYTRTPSGQKSSRSGFCEILIYIGSVKSKVMTSQVSRDPIRSGFKNLPFHGSVPFLFQLTTLSLRVVEVYIFKIEKRLHCFFWDEVIVIKPESNHEFLHLTLIRAGGGGTLLCLDVNVAKKSGKVNVTDLVKNRFPAIFGTYLTWIYQKNILKDFYVPVF